MIPTIAQMDSPRNGASLVMATLWGLGVVGITPVVQAQPVLVSTSPDFVFNGGGVQQDQFPAGANLVRLVVKGAGGGSGGDDSGPGGRGASGSLVSGQVQGVPGRPIHVFVGGGGSNGGSSQGGDSTKAAPADGAGGAGGVGQGAGSAGGSAGLVTNGANPRSRNSGAGGGGGGSSAVQVEGLAWARAGGGGGGGGGSSAWRQDPSNDGSYANWGPIFPPAAGNGPRDGNWGPGTAGQGMPGGMQYVNPQPFQKAGTSAPPTLLDYSVLTQYFQNFASNYPPAGRPPANFPQVASIGRPLSLDMNPNCGLPGNLMLGLPPADGLDGGGGGGAGGTYQGGEASRRAQHGRDTRWVAEGGLTGQSCASGYYEAVQDNFNATGGSAGAPFNTTSALGVGVHGSVTLSYYFDPDRVPTLAVPTSTNDSIHLTVTAPVTLPPGQVPSMYTVNCASTAAGAVSPLTINVPAANIAAGATLQGATPGATYQCTATASLVDSATAQPTIDTLPSSPQTVTPLIAPVLELPTSGNEVGGFTVTPPAYVPPNANYVTVCNPGNHTVSGSGAMNLSGLTNGTTYSCTSIIQELDGAGNIIGESGPSNPVSFTPMAPVPPLITGTTSGDKQGTLSFDPPAQLPTNVTVQGYSASCLPGNITATGASPMQVPGLTNDTVYACKVSAILSDGTQLESSNTGTLTPKGVTAPVIPSTTSGDKQGTLIITPPGNLPAGVTVTDYTATCSPGNITASGAAPLEIKGLTNGTTYTCTVVANLSNGAQSPVSQSATLSPKAAAAVNATPVPTLSQWGVLLLGALTALFGALRMRNNFHR